MVDLPNRFRLYIDESGDHTYRHMHKEDRRYFGLTGIMLPYSSDYTIFHASLQALKDSHFVTHPDNPVILHREDIIQKRKWFVVLRDPKKEKEFNNDLLGFIQKQAYSVISVAMDKKSHWDEFENAANHPYHYCLKVMLERYCGWLNATGRVGDVMAESRGGKEDRMLKEEYTNLFEKGTYFKSAKFFQQGLTTRKLKVRKKEANISGLQLADMLAHPCKQDILVELGKVEDKRSDFVKEICVCMNAEKYNRRIVNRQIWGYGKKYLG